MKFPNLKESTGMIVDGVFASEAIDSSGEILDVKGADITDFEDGKGVINYEHISEDRPGASPNDIVGRIIYAKKVYSEKDCASERERKYWKSLELPFIYGIVRLHDGAGHPGAVAAAAHFRDYAANKEQFLGRWSIEGSTLARGDGSDSNRLTHTVCRRVALTWKPCNKSADSSLVLDPNAPKGFVKEPNSKEVDRLAQLAEVSKKERVGRNIIGYGPEFDASEILDLAKATEAGSYNAAPGALVGGAALQVEDAGLRRKLHLNIAKAAVRDWKPAEGKFKAFLKNRLPDADPDFIDKFADMVDDYKLKKKEPADPDRPLSIRGKYVKPTPTVDKAHFDEKAGVLRTPRGSIPMYIPSRDPQPGAAQAFHNALHDPAATKIHDYALKNWGRLHGLLKKGKLPDAVVMHASLFSQLSPNTPVPTQELMYGHLVDAMKDTGIDARDPRFPTIKENWIGRDNPTEWPVAGGNHYNRIQAQLRNKVDSKLTGRKAGEIGGFMLANNKFKNMSEYHKLHGKLADLVGRHKEDARSAVNELMQHKTKGELWEAQRARAKAKGQPDIGDYNGPVVAGLAQKTARYMYGMLGGGNTVVPDTHFIRHLFGLEKGNVHTQGHLDNHTIDYIKDLLWNGHQSSGALEGIDRYYNAHHDAVNHLAQNPAVQGIDRKDLTFPAFWKHWMAIAPHEAARGMGTMGHNELTDHKPYWDTVLEHIENRKRPVAKADLEAYRKAQDSVKEHMHWQETLGEFPAMMLYYAYIVPELLGEEEKSNPELGIDLTDTPNGDVDPMVKFEAFSIDLRIKLDELLKAEASEDTKRWIDNARKGSPKPAAVSFQGKKVIPGHVRLPNADKGVMEDHAILGHDAKHFYTVPIHPAQLTDWQPHEVQRINKMGIGGHLSVDRWPEFVDSGNVIDAKEHGDPDFNQSPEQEKLIHGLDMEKGFLGKPDSGISRDFNHWRKHPAGHQVFVKGEGETKSGMRAEPWNEAAYHNVARDVFDLGHYVPPVAVFTHPTTGETSSAVGKVLEGEHHKGHDPMHKEVIQNMTHSGDLHKLAMMDFVMGHTDRHSGNYLMTPHADAQMQLIDNADILKSDPNNYDLGAPDYLKEGGDWSEPISDAPIHDNQQDWAMKLDPKKLTESLAKMHYDPHTIRGAVDRLNFLKGTIAHLRNSGTQMTAKHLYDPQERIPNRNRFFRRDI